MSIDRLSPTAALIAAIRGEPVRRSAGRQAASVDGASGRTPGASVSRRPTEAQLQRQLVDLVKPVVAEDLVAVRKARPAIIRTVLLWEFGPQFRENPEWQSMMRRIESALDRADPEMRALSALIRNLQGAAAKP